MSKTQLKQLTIVWAIFLFGEIIALDVTQNRLWLIPLVIHSILFLQNIMKIYFGKWSEQ